jgi:hypothetical protein
MQYLCIYICIYIYMIIYIYDYIYILYVCVLYNSGAWGDGTLETSGNCVCTGVVYRGTYKFTQM